MDVETIMQNIDANTKTELEASKEYYKSQPEDVSETTEIVDIYQRDVNDLRENAKKSYPHGASQIVNMAVHKVIDGEGGEGLAHALKRARDDSESLKKRGERERAELVKKQYMQEHFLPAVEIVVNSASPDELLNSKQALSLLDQYALLEGSGRGYTASYVRESYKDLLGQVIGRDSPSVRNDILRINTFLDNGEIRSAVGLANKLNRQINSGEAMASDETYDLLGRILAFYG